MDKTTLAGTITAVGMALAGSGLTEVMPEFITELVPMWARQAGAMMVIVGTVLTARFALDKSAVHPDALKPITPPSKSTGDTPTPSVLP